MHRTALALGLTVMLSASLPAAQIANLRVMPPDFDFARLCKTGTDLKSDPLDLTRWNGGPLDASDETLLDIANFYRSGTKSADPQPDLAVRLYLHIASNFDGRHSAAAKYQAAKLLMGKDAPSIAEESQAVQFLVDATAFGIGAAAAELGLLYEEGRLVERDLERAARYYRIAAVAAQPEAAFALARLYSDGLIASPGPDAARQMASLGLIELLSQASTGQCSALLRIARIYDRGQAVQQDKEVAAAWFLAGAKAGDRRSMTEIAERFAGGVGVALDLDTAISWYGRAADAGSFEAAFEIGRLYSAGEGLEPDAAKAQSWLERAATDGSLKAMQRLGEFWAGELEAVPPQGPDLEKAVTWLEAAFDADPDRLGVLHSLADVYMDSNGATSNPDRAVDLYRLAAAQGSTSAMRNLGEAYLDGIGTEPDSTLALRLFRQAGARGDASSYLTLDRLYRCGIGTEQSVAQADRWLDRAASQGSRSSMLALAERHLAEGTPEALAKRRLILLRATVQGSRKAMVALAETYAAGIGVEPNPSQVARWTELALRDGTQEATIEGLTAMAEAILGDGPLAGTPTEATALLERAVALGSPAAKYQLGQILIEGAPGVSIDQQRGTALLSAATKAGHASAPRALARMSMVEGDRDTALALLSDAVALGARLARLDRAQVLYADGSGTVAEKDKARAELAKAIAAHPCSPAETIAIAEAYANGIGGVDQQAEALRWIAFTREAFPADGDMTLRLGRIALKTARTQEETNFAVALISDAAERGSVKAMYRLYELHARNSIPNAQPNAASLWLTRAAGAGDPRALHRRGMNAAAGTDGAVDFAAATADLQNAADRGHTPAMRQLAKWHMTGLTGSLDGDQALTLLEQAASLGDTRAMLDLANQFSVGIAVTPDATAAVDWLKTAAQRGNGEAMHRLSIAYATGFGVTPDSDEAQVWIQRAIDTGYLAQQPGISQ